MDAVGFRKPPEFMVAKHWPHENLDRQISQRVWPMGTLRSENAEGWSPNVCWREIEGLLRLLPNCVINLRSHAFLSCWCGRFHHYGRIDGPSNVAWAFVCSVETPRSTSLSMWKILEAWASTIIGFSSSGRWRRLPSRRGLRGFWWHWKGLFHPLSWVGFALSFVHFSMELGGSRTAGRRHLRSTSVSRTYLTVQDSSLQREGSGRTRYFPPNDTGFKEKEAGWLEY